MERSILTSQETVGLPNINPLRVAFEVSHEHSHLVWRPNVPALGPRLREDDEQRNGHDAKSDVILC